MCEFTTRLQEFTKGTKKIIGGVQKLIKRNLGTMKRMIIWAVQCAAKSLHGRATCKGMFGMHMGRILMESVNSARKHLHEKAICKSMFQLHTQQIQEMADVVSVKKPFSMNTY